MSAELIMTMILVITIAAQQTLPINGLCNGKNYDDFNKNISTKDLEMELEQDSLKKGQSFNIMDLILFQPHVPKVENIEESNTINNITKDLRFKRNTQIENDDESYNMINKSTVKKERLRKIKDAEVIKSDYLVKKYVTNKPSAKYEITENVIDIPDDRTPAGPIVPNYTPYKNIPINLGTPTNKTEIKNVNGDEYNENSKSRVNILHIKAKFDESKKNQSKIKTFFKDVKQYITEIKLDFVEGINKLFHKDKSHDKEFADFDKLTSSEEVDKVDEDDFGELHRTIHKDFTHL